MKVRVPTPEDLEQLHIRSHLARFRFQHTSRRLRALKFVLAFGALAWSCVGSSEGPKRTSAIEQRLPPAMPCFEPRWRVALDEIGNARDADEHDHSVFLEPIADVDGDRCEDLVVVPVCEIHDLVGSCKAWVCVLSGASGRRIATASVAWSDAQAFDRVAKLPAEAHPLLFIAGSCAWDGARVSRVGIDEVTLSGADFRLLPRGAGEGAVERDAPDDWQLLRAPFLAAVAALGARAATQSRIALDWKESQWSFEDVLDEKPERLVAVESSNAWRPSSPRRLVLVTERDGAPPSVAAPMTGARKAASARAVRDWTGDGVSEVVLLDLPTFGVHRLFVCDVVAGVDLAESKSEEGRELDGKPIAVLRDSSASPRELAVFAMGVWADRSVCDWPPHLIALEIVGDGANAARQRTGASNVWPR